LKSNIDCGVTFRLCNLTKQKWYRIIVKNSSIPLFKVRRYKAYYISKYIVHFTSRIEYLIGKLSFYLHLAIFLTVNFSSKLNDMEWYEIMIYEKFYVVWSHLSSVFFHVDIVYLWIVKFMLYLFNCCFQILISNFLWIFHYHMISYIE